MKKILLRIPLFLSFSVVCGSIFAQQQYEVLEDKEEGKILKGVISRDLIEKDTSFHWFSENQKGYTPYPQAVAALKKNTDLAFITFMGTWCHDSHFVIPRFFALLDSVHYPAEKITLIGTDRDKKALGQLTDSLNVINVPTIIVMKGGRDKLHPV